MCIATKCIDGIIEICDLMNESFDRLTAELKKNDLAIQDMLHYIEFEEFNQVIGFAAVQKIKELRVLRREVKEELELLLTMKNMLDIKTMKKIRSKIDCKIFEQSKRRYSPRVIKGGLSKAANE